MHGSELAELTVAYAESDADLEAMIDVRRRVDPDVRPSVAGLRHNLVTSEAGLAYLVGRLGAEPVGDEVVGFAALDVFGPRAFHGLTAVKRAWRRRGIATALKQAEFRAAKRAGFERLLTGSEERNVPMRRLNEKLGFRPDPAHSTIVMRGPLV